MVVVVGVVLTGIGHVRFRRCLGFGHIAVAFAAVVAAVAAADDDVAVAADDAFAFAVAAAAVAVGGDVANVGIVDEVDAGLLIGAAFAADADAAVAVGGVAAFATSSPTLTWVYLVWNQCDATFASTAD